MKQLSNLELWNIISKEYVGTKEVQQIACVGKSKALKLKEQIIKELNDWLLPRNLVPTEKVLEKLKINRNDIFKKAKMERELA